MDEAARPGAANGDPAAVPRAQSDHGPAALEAFFRPRSVAVIGASADPARIGGRPVRYLKEHFKGLIYPVNPGRDEVQGLPAYRSVRDIGAPVDLALLCVPAEAVLESLQECTQAFVTAGIIVSAGFAEAGPEGARRQERASALAARAGLRLLGPNCLGCMDFHSGALCTFSIVLDFAPPQAGRVAIVSQSGAFAAHAYALACARGLGLCKWITTGNECDVDAADCIAFLAEDPDTAVIMAYLEGCRDGAKLCAALEAARAAGKPVVAIKVGRSDAGARAALSHTAAIAGADAVFDAVFRQYGVHRAATIDEFFDVAHAASTGRLPRGGRVGIVTMSGGVGGFMADRCALNGLDVPALSPELRRDIAAFLPFATASNPLDITAHIINRPELLEQGLDALLSAGLCDAVAVFLTTVMYSESLRDPLLDAFARVRQRHPEMPIVLAMLAPEEARRRLAELGYARIEEPARAIDALAALAGIRAALERPPRPVPPPPDAACRLHLPHGPLSEHAAKAALAEAGLPFAREALAGSAADAAAQADDIGYPVALKLASPDIAHKSEAGGVLLGIADADAVRAGFDRILDNARSYAPAARIDGVLVAEMIGGGVEMILGARLDPTFGPIVMVGTGGVLVEHLRDTALALAPIAQEEARALIRSLKARPLLEGVRGRPPVAIDALARALARLSQVMAANADRIESVEINPFFARPKGAHSLGVDALIVRRHKAPA